MLRTDQEVERAVIQNGVRAVLAVGPSVRTEQAALLRSLAASGCVVWEVDADVAPYPARERVAGFACRRLDLAPVRAAARASGCSTSWCRGRCCWWSARCCWCAR